MMAKPRAPLWDRNPTRPGSGTVGPKVASRRTCASVFTILRQLGPMRRIPAARQTASSSRWRWAPSDLVSAKPAETTHHRPHPWPRTPSPSPPRGRRHGQHRQVDRAGDVQHRLVGQDRLDHRGLGVDGVHRAVETGRQQVVEQLAGDGAAPPRGADDRHRPWFEEGAHGGRRATCSRCSNRSLASGDREVGNSTSSAPGRLWVVMEAELRKTLTICDSRAAPRRRGPGRRPGWPPRRAGRAGSCRAPCPACRRRSPWPPRPGPAPRVGLALRSARLDHQLVGPADGDQPVAAVVVDLCRLTGRPPPGSGSRRRTGASGCARTSPSAAVRSRARRRTSPAAPGRSSRPAGRRRPPDDRAVIMAITLRRPDLEDAGHAAGEASAGRSRRPTSGRGRQVHDPVADRHPVGAWCRAPPPAATPGHGRLPRRCGPAPAAGPAGQMPTTRRLDDRDGLDASLQHELARVGDVGPSGSADHVARHRLGCHLEAVADASDMGRCAVGSGVSSKGIRSASDRMPTRVTARPPPARR